MKFSLLYKNYEETREFTSNPFKEAMEETVYDLSVDKAIRTLAETGEAAVYTLEVLKAPLKTAEEIEYRQAVLTDFVANPKLLEELKDIFKNYDRPGQPDAFPPRPRRTLLLREDQRWNVRGQLHGAEHGEAAGRRSRLPQRHPALPGQLEEDVQRGPRLRHRHQGGHPRP